MKISYNDLIRTVAAPFSEPLPIVRHEQDSPYVEAGFPRAVAEARLATDCLLSAFLKGLTAPPLGAAGVAILARRSVNSNLMMLPAAAVGALGGWGLGTVGACVDGARGALFACVAGGNVVYGAGTVVAVVTREIMGTLQRHMPEHGNLGPVRDGKPDPKGPPLLPPLPHLPEVILEHEEHPHAD